MSHSLFPSAENSYAREEGEKEEQKAKLAEEIKTRQREFDVKVWVLSTFSFTADLPTLGGRKQRVVYNSMSCSLCFVLFDILRPLFVN